MSPRGTTLTEKIFFNLVILGSAIPLQANASNVPFSQNGQICCLQQSSSTIEVKPNLLSTQVIERTLSQIKITKSVLSISELLEEEVAFPKYLENLDKILTFHRTNPLTPESILNMGTQLLNSMLTLQAEVERLSSWFSLNEAINPEAGRGVVIPDRFFVSVNHIETDTYGPSEADFALWQDLDLMNA